MCKRLVFAGNRAGCPSIEKQCYAVHGPFLFLCLKDYPVDSSFKDPWKRESRQVLKVLIDIRLSEFLAMFFYILVIWIIFLFKL